MRARYQAERKGINVTIQDKEYTKERRSNLRTYLSFVKVLQLRRSLQLTIGRFIASISEGVGDGDLSRCNGPPLELNGVSRWCGYA